MVSGLSVLVRVFWWFACVYVCVCVCACVSGRLRDEARNQGKRVNPLQTQHDLWHLTYVFMRGCVCVCVSVCFYYACVCVCVYECCRGGVFYVLQTRREGYGQGEITFSQKHGHRGRELRYMLLSLYGHQALNKPLSWAMDYGYYPLMRFTWIWLSWMFRGNLTCFLSLSNLLTLIIFENLIYIIW